MGELINISTSPGTAVFPTRAITVATLGFMNKCEDVINGLYFIHVSFIDPNDVDLSNFYIQDA